MHHAIQWRSKLGDNIMIKIGVDAYIEYLERTTKLLNENKDYVTRLDAETGDGDHWANMNMGFGKLMGKKDEMAQLPLDKLFRECGMTMMSGVGGSSGVLYGSAYIALAKAFAGKTEITEADLVLYLVTQVDAISNRGKAVPGNKTMLDPLNEARLAVERAVTEGKTGDELLAALKEGAKRGMEATADMPAFKGRACYRPDKGVGHLDPGAVTMEYQLRAFADTMLDRGREA